MKKTVKGKSRDAIKPTQSASYPTSQPVLLWLGVGSSRSLMLFLLLGAVLVSGLMVVKTTHENRFAFNELQMLREEANQLDVEWGQLLLEQSTFGLDGRIEQKAVEQLRMQVPEIDYIVMVRRDAREL
ncbi:MAG: cell division protein FtsL [Gammaproteobacteria bacterium]|jgi:cell division protein FtsL|nr:cell division protein FtsL [Gammaproteobacteria bacterium]